MNLDNFISAFKTSFPAHDIYREGDFVTVPGACRELGAFHVVDDGDELTVYVGDITHGHFGIDDDTLPHDLAEREVVADVIDFFSATFADKIEFYRNTYGGGGWRPAGTGPEPSVTWSGDTPGGA